MEKPDKKGKLKTQHGSERTGKTVMKELEQTFIKSLCLTGVPDGTDPCAIDVKNGKIVRIRPMHYDWKYTREEMKPWKIEKNGKVLEAPLKAMTCPWLLAYKKRTYSPNRIKYPLKRVDWDPNGERNPQNRGKSKFKRISWDEAIEIIVSELKRVREKYGPFAVLAQGDGHGETKLVHSSHGCHMGLLDKMGDFTMQVRNPDSWEGWYWGAMHVWGTMAAGVPAPQDNIVKAITENTGMILWWSCDPETTPWGLGGQFESQLCYFWTDIGIKQVFINPELNYGAAVHADKWIPILPNTDVALQLAIAYVWINEGTYDKAYVATHTVGYEKFEDYVTGREDGAPKTPEWASSRCGVPEWTIKALAREFAARTTTIAHMLGGGMIRGPYSHEPARMEGLLLGMQGLGKPGVYSASLPTQGMPRETAGVQMFFPVKNAPIGKAWRGRFWLMGETKQFIPKTLVHKAILNPPVSSMGSGAILAQVEDQFVKYTYPIPEKEGGTEVHMIWCDNPCRTTCWNGGYETIEAQRSAKIETVITQHPWLENECLFSDIILPVSTKLEEEDIQVIGNSQPLKGIHLEEKCIEPVGESMSDYEIVCEVAKKLGMYEEYTEGKTVRDWMKHAFEETGVARMGLTTWEKLNDKGYFIVPPAGDWEKDSPFLFKFYQDPEKNPLGTPSGKLEFYSERIARYFPDDYERPPVPHWVEKSEMHDERLSGERAKKYTLLAVSNHGRWRMHAQCDDISWTREIQTCKIKGPDGYMYEPLWLNPKTATDRGINSGDIVKVYNERGAVLGGAYVTERIMPGVAYMDHGARCDPIIPEELDRGGAINLISPDKVISKNCAGQATTGFLVEVEKVSPAQMEEWRRQYPEAFEREYNPASGLRFNAWVEGGMQ